MKNRFSLLALLLAFVMLFQSVAFATESGIAIDTLDMASYNSLFDGVSSTMYEPFIEQLAALESMDARYEQLALWHDSVLGAVFYKTFVSYYHATYPDGNLMCACEAPHRYGTAEHTAADCPWAFVNLPLKEQHDILAGLAEEEKQSYLATLDAAVQDKLARVNAKAYTLTADGIALSLNVPDGAFAADYLLTAAHVSDETANAALVNAINAALADVTPFEVLDSVAFDLSFLKLEDEASEMQPAETCTLTFDVSGKERSDAYELRVYHMVEDANGEYTAELAAVSSPEDETIAVAADGFSIYVVTGVGETIGTLVNANSTHEMNIGDETTFYWEKDYANWNVLTNKTWTVENGEGIVEWTVYREPGMDGTYQEESYPYIKIKALSPGTATVTMKYSRNNTTIETQWFNVKVKEADFYIKDQVAQDGCIVPAGSSIDKWVEGVTYEWSRNDGATIKASAYSGIGINVGIDRGGVTETSGKYEIITYKVVAKDAKGTELASAFYTIPYGGQILNASFETPKILTDHTNSSFPNGTKDLFWKTTGVGAIADDGKVHIARDIEIVNGNMQGSYGVAAAADGKQFAEVNAEAFGTLYQDILTAPGATLTWHFAHAGRTQTGSNNTLYVVLAPTEGASKVVGAAQVQQVIQAAGSQFDGAEHSVTIDDTTFNFRIWKHVPEKNGVWYTDISGSYRVPEDQYLTRLFFASDATAGTATLGNLIDAASSQETLKYKIEYYVNGELKEADTEIGVRNVYTYQPAEHLANYLKQYTLTSATVNGWSYPADVTADDFAGFYVAPYLYSSQDEEYQNILRLYFKDEAITVSKTVTVDNWKELNALQQSKLMNGYEAEFTLYKVGTDEDGNKTETAVSKVTIPITYAEDQQLYALGEFSKQLDGETNFNLENVTYVVKETSCPELNGYALATTYGNDLQEPAEFTVTESERRFTTSCTNAYTFKRGAMSITKNVVDSNFPADGKIFTFSVKPVEEQDLTEWLIENPSYTAIKEDGVVKGFTASLTVDSSKTATLSFSSLPAGKYEVVENPDVNYTTTYQIGTAQATQDKAEAVVPQDGEVAVTVTNSIKTTSLTIRKTGTQTIDHHEKEGSTSGIGEKESQSYIFRVQSADDNGIDLKVVINGDGSTTITNLPLGEYTVTEMEDWSWRYDAEDGETKTITLTADQNGEVNFTNDRTKVQWLSGDSYAENSFGAASGDE